MHTLKVGTRVVFNDIMRQWEPAVIQAGEQGEVVSCWADETRIKLCTPHPELCSYDNCVWLSTLDPDLPTILVQITVVKSTHHLIPKYIAAKDTTLRKVS